MFLYNWFACVLGDRHDLSQADSSEKPPSSGPVTSKSTRWFSFENSHFILNTILKSKSCTLFYFLCFLFVQIFCQCLLRGSADQLFTLFYFFVFLFVKILGDQGSVLSEHSHRQVTLKTTIAQNHQEKLFFMLGEYSCWIVVFLKWMYFGFLSGGQEFGFFSWG